jgi:prepilin-type N-terminal cleavage/methylation domain-containing protein
MKRKTGFTLIELLVVIAIIGLLLSIILPSLKIAKDRAMEVLCENNIRQFSIGMNAYCNDNDGTFPDAEDWFLLDLVRVSSGGKYPDNPSSLLNFNCVWHNDQIIPDGLIVSYLSNDDVRVCPAFKRIALTKSRCAQGAPTHNPNIPVVPQFNYTQNLFLGPLGNTRASSFVRKITQVKSPSRVFAYGEENPYNIPSSNLRPYYGTFTVKVSSQTPVNDCLLWVIAPGGAKAEIDRVGSKYNYPPIFVDCLASYHRAKDAEGLLGYSKAVFVDGHIQNVVPEESLIYAWPF